MISVNDVLLDLQINHAVSLQKYSNAVIRKVIATLNRSDARLYEALIHALEQMEPSSFTMERLRSLLASANSINAAAYQQVGLELTDNLKQFAAQEATFQHQAIQSVLPISFRTNTINLEQVVASAVSRPFQGNLLKGFLDDLEAGRAKKIRTTIAQGFTEGKTTSEIVKELRGTRARGFADGLLDGNRREVEAVARTALSHMGQFVANATAADNVDIVKAVAWISTIDLVTSIPCRLRDLKEYTPVTHTPIGHSLPWGGGPGAYHWNCRSAQAYRLKSNEELGIDLPEIVMKNGTRATLDGAAPASLAYPQWLEKQSAERQIEILGPTRARLMRDGKLSLADMYSRKGQYYSIAELRAQDVKAFERAGL